MPFKSVRDEIEANHERAREIADAAKDDQHGVILDTVENAFEGIRQPASDDPDTKEALERRRLANDLEQRDLQETKEEIEKL